MSRERRIGIRGQASVGQPSKLVCGSTLGSEPGEEPSHDGEGGFRVSFPSSASVGEVIGKLNPILKGWCTYFRVGNSNRIFHQIDWAVLSELQLWLRRKHQCSWRSAGKRWSYQFLSKRCRVYPMVGRVSHLPGLRRTPPTEDGRRAGCGQPARPVR